jgi:cystathionine beta-lyase
LSEAELRSRAGRKWHRYDQDVLPAWIAEMDFGVAEPIQRALLQMAQEACYGYEGETLKAELADAFADHMADHFGWRPDAAGVVPVADLVQALFACVTAFTRPGDGVVLQMPIYPPFQAAVRDSGRCIVEHPLLHDGTRFLLDRASVPDAGLLLLCNPHNPTGRVFERSELDAIAQAAVERDAVVIADEIHADLTYPPHTHIPFATLGPEVAERTVTITSATKAYNIPGLRCGLMHFGSAGLRERFRAAFPDRMLGTVNSFGIQATVTAWRECTPWLDDVMEVLRGNRALLTRFLATELPEIGYHEPEATYLSWLDCRELELPMSPQQFFLERARVGLNDGAEFGAPGAGHVRLNFATAPEILQEVLERMAAAVRSR